MSNLSWKPVGFKISTAFSSSLAYMEFHVKTQLGGGLYACAL
jgi:hypothetical protein